MHWDSLNNPSPDARDRDLQNSGLECFRLAMLLIRFLEKMWKCTAQKNDYMHPKLLGKVHRCPIESHPLA